VTQSCLGKEIAGRRNRRHDRDQISRRPCQICCGAIEPTIPGCLPEKVALLRLDTDWFTSTYHELLHFWHGVMIIDDYGYWAGAMKAVDEHFREVGLYPFLHRIDDTGRLIIRCKQ
jgi:hypothetical protein